MFQFKLQDISTYRNALMGIAIIWIMFYHFGFNFPVIGYLLGTGFTGVDIFIFLSGFGLFYSLAKGNFTWSKYLKKRVLRIFPAYMIVGLFLNIFLYNDSLLKYFWKCSTLGYWTNGIYYEWFVPAILTLYILYPFIKKKRNVKLQMSAIIITLFISFLCITFPSIVDNWHFLLIYRIPIFLFGSFTALCIKNQKSPLLFLCPALIGVLLFGLLFITKRSELRYLYFSFTFLTPLIILFCVVCIKRMNLFNKWMGTIGTYTLEIYLVHIIFLKYLRTIDCPVLASTITKI